DVTKLVGEVLLTPTTYFDLFSVETCLIDERVFMGAREGDYIYLYETLVDVVNVLNIAPNKLHPNRWAAMQAFQVICHFLLHGAYRGQVLALIRRAFVPEIQMDLVDEYPQCGLRRGPFEILLLGRSTLLSFVLVVSEQVQRLGLRRYVNLQPARSRRSEQFTSRS
ncbi:hypothetical protein CR513_49818, partial [Mucuna pruriens]